MLASLRAVAHAGADAWRTTCCASSAWRPCRPAHARRPAGESAGALPARLRAGSSDVRERYRAPARASLCAPRAVRRRVPGCVRRLVVRARALSSARTSSRAWTAARSTCTCARRPARASRRPPSSATRSRRRFAASSASELETHRRQHRPAVQRHQPRLQHFGTDRPRDADILVGLKGEPRPTADYVRRCARAAAQFPAATFSFLPADIVSQILNFGLPAPIDVQMIGSERGSEPTPMPQQLLTQITHDPRHRRPAHPAADRQPKLHVTVDRTRPRQLGLTQRDVANNLLSRSRGSSQTAPTYWLNPKNGVSYLVAVQTPQYRHRVARRRSQNIPVTGRGRRRTQIWAASRSI